MIGNCTTTTAVETFRAKELKEMQG